VTIKTPTYPESTQITYVFENVSSLLKRAIRSMMMGISMIRGMQILYGKAYKQYYALTF